MGGGGGNKQPVDAAPGKESVLCAAASGCPGTEAAEGSASPQERRAPGRLSRWGESQSFVPADGALLAVALEITAETLGDSEQAGGRTATQELAMCPIELGKLRRVLCRRQGGGLGDQAELSSSRGGAHENLCGHNKLSYVVGLATIARTQQPRGSAPSRDSAHHPSVLGNVRMSKWSDGEEGAHQTLSLCKGNRNRQSKPNQADIS